MTQDERVKEFIDQQVRRWTADPEVLRRRVSRVLDELKAKGVKASISLGKWPHDMRIEVEATDEVSRGAAITYILLGLTHD